MADQDSSVLSRADPVAPADVVIVGAGLSGTLAAIMLARADIKVTLIDPREVYPPEFRAERLVGSQVATLKEMGLLEMLVQDAIPAERTIASRAGKIIEIVSAPHYGLRYEDMVNRAREHIPSSVQVIRDKASHIELSAYGQRVTLSGGQVAEGRLVVMATGPGNRLLSELGIGKVIVCGEHSLCFGFDVETGSAGKFRSSVLVAYGKREAGSIDYLTVFPLGNGLRANLFTFGDYRDDWAKGFVSEPAETLRLSFPSLEGITGAISISGKVDVRVNPLTRAEKYLRDGIVLIGDAFRNSCPAVGNGISLLLNDIGLLCNRYIPDWLATNKMDVSKISRFYDDPIKLRCDAKSLHDANYRRSCVLETGTAWKVHRERVALQKQVILFARWMTQGKARGEFMYKDVWRRAK